MKKVAIYARVSTADQSVDAQLMELRAVAEAHDWEVFEEYVDHGISGTKESRPSLDKLMADAKMRRFTAVLVWKFDRFARSTLHLASALQEFQGLGVDFLSHRESIDTSNAYGKFFFDVTAAFAELERNLISERTKASLRLKKARGERLGRKPANIDAQTVRDMRTSGLSFQTIGNTLGFSRETVRKAISV